MFLNTPTAKKLFKRAFNSTCLIVSRPDFETIYIAGSKWQIEMEYETMPLKQKAQLIELLGDIPDVGKRILATKNEQQMEFEVGERLREYYMRAKTQVYQAPVVIARPYFDYQLFQEQDEKSFVAVDRELMSLIDIREIDFENEGMPSGPCMIPNGNCLFWHNGAGTLCISLEEIDKEALEIIDLLKNVEIRREE